MVYGVGVEGDYVWVATAAGARPPEHAHRSVELLQRAQHADVRDLDLRCARHGTDKVYYAVWGGGVLEYDVKTERWKDYNDPDGETEMVLFKDQGLIHEITTRSATSRRTTSCGRPLTSAPAATTAATGTTFSPRTAACPVTS